MKKTGFCILFSCVFGVDVAFSQENPELVTLIQKSILYYPELKQSKTMIDISNYQMDLTKSAYKPVISADLSYTYVDPVAKVGLPLNGSNYVFQFAPNHNYNGQISVNQPIYNFGRTKAQVSQAKSNYALAVNTYESNESGFAYQIADLYYYIVYLKNNLLLYESQIETLKETHRMVESRYENGIGLQFDVVSTQVNLNDMIDKKNELQSLLQKQLVLLKSVTGQEEQINHFEFVDHLDYRAEKMHVDSMLNRAIDQSPEYNRVKTKEKAAEQSVIIAKKEFNPTLGLGLTGGYKNGYPPDLMEGKWNYSVGVGLNIPLYSAGRNTTKEHIANLNAKASKFERETMLITLQKDIEQSVLDLQTFSERIRFSEMQIDQAGLAQELAIARFKHGVITNIELLDAQNKLLAGQVQKIQYQYQLKIAELRLLRLQGDKFW